MLISVSLEMAHCFLGKKSIYEPPHGKTNNVVSEQVLHEPGCTSTEDG